MDCWRGGGNIAVSGDTHTHAHSQTHTHTLTHTHLLVWLPPCRAAMWRCTRTSATYRSASAPLRTQHSPRWASCSSGLQTARSLSSSSEGVVSCCALGIGAPWCSVVQAGRHTDTHTQTHTHTDTHSHTHTLTPSLTHAHVVDTGTDTKLCGSTGP